jgi:hypothetical protein
MLATLRADGWRMRRGDGEVSVNHRGEVQVLRPWTGMFSCTVVITESRVTCLEKEIPKVKL